MRIYIVLVNGKVIKGYETLESAIKLFVLQQS